MPKANKKHQAPRTNMLQYNLGRLWLWLMGWKVKGEVPPKGTKFLLVAAPHTSNWDFPFTLAAAYAFKLQIKWVGKHTLFRFPFGGIMKFLGGIPVNRKSTKGFVGQMVHKFKETEKLVVTISPSGTRDRLDHWRSGFYWITYEAQVPLLLGYLDYTNKVACLGLSFMPTGNIQK